MKVDSPFNSPKVFSKFEVARNRPLFMSGELTSGRRQGVLGLAGIEKSTKLLRKIEGSLAVYYQQQDDGSYIKVCVRKSPTTSSASLQSSPLRSNVFTPIKAADLLTRYQTHSKLLNDDPQRCIERHTDRPFSIMTPKLSESPKRKLRRTSSQNLSTGRAKTSQLRLSLDYLSSQCLSIKTSVRASTSGLSAYKTELSDRLRLLIKELEAPIPSPYKVNLHNAYISKANLFRSKPRRRT